MNTSSNRGEQLDWDRSYNHNLFNLRSSFTVCYSYNNILKTTNCARLGVNVWLPNPDHHHQNIFTSHGTNHNYQSEISSRLSICVLWFTEGIARENQEFMDYTPIEFLLIHEVQRR